MSSPLAAQAVSVPPAPPGVDALLRVWHKLEWWVAVLSFSFIAAVLMIDVLGREFYGPVMSMLGFSVGASGLFGSQKLAVFALVIGSFAGIGIATAKGVHLVPPVAFKWVPASWSPHMARIADVFTGAVPAGGRLVWRAVRDRVQGIRCAGGGDQRLRLADPDGQLAGL